VIAAPAQATTEPIAPAKTAVSSSESVVLRPPARVEEGDMPSLADRRVHQSISSRGFRRDRIWGKPGFGVGCGHPPSHRSGRLRTMAEQTRPVSAEASELVLGSTSSPPSVESDPPPDPGGSVRPSPRAHHP
jgi:hypothetical protein